jgi:glyoxylase-like metal-dependent hydrolase (beta-lactamase superfamily II)
MEPAGSEVWTEVGAGVFVRRHRSFDLNVGLVVAGDRALVVDTRGSERQGHELLAAVRAVAPARTALTVVNTHAHFDHFFGNAAFRPAPMWACTRCAEVAVRDGALQREAMTAAARQAGKDEAADDIAATTIVAPDHTFDLEHVLDVGGRGVTFTFLGRAHTDNDVVVTVPDASVVFAGDLVEEGAPPSYYDAYPLDWPATAERLATIAATADAVVPGHGAVVDVGFVRRQQAEIAALADLASAGYAAGEPLEAVVSSAPFGEVMSKVALERAYAQLAGTL